jgi:RNA polymerase subunit RPABC4/transcription elongation factor Spt4
MPVCSNCNIQISETAKFCPECGIRLSTAASDLAWIAAMREKIKDAKQNDLTYTICAAFGVAIAILVPFAMRFILKYRMDLLSWLLALVGILFFIGGAVGIWYDGKKVKELTEQLEKGQKHEGTSS